MKRYLVLLPIGVLLLAGCSRDYQPKVDPTFAKDRPTLERDLYECEQIAKKASKDPAGEAGKGALIGGAAGAAGGALIGAAAGAPGTGAAIGAATGVAAGSVIGGTQAQKAYKKAYDSCMRNRGYKLLE